MKLNRRLCLLRVKMHILLDSEAV